MRQDKSAALVGVIIYTFVSLLCLIALGIDIYRGSCVAIIFQSIVSAGNIYFMIDNIITYRKTCIKGGDMDKSS